MTATKHVQQYKFQNVFGKDEDLELSHRNSFLLSDSYIDSICTSTKNTLRKREEGRGEKIGRKEKEKMGYCALNSNRSLGKGGKERVNEREKRRKIGVEEESLSVSEN